MSHPLHYEKGAPRWSAGSNRPANIPSVDDYDFGAAPLLFRPRGCPPLAAANNKNTHLYVWDRTRLAWDGLTRVQLLTSALAPLLKVLGSDLRSALA